jgi:ABC-type protease/lipase transport system fused ATPase/permease subunit
MRDFDKMIKVFLAAGGLIIVLIATIFVNKNNAEKGRQEVTTEVTTSITQEDTSKTTKKETTTTEAMTEAPHDTSDWETQKPDSTEPDTGATIDEKEMIKE